MNQSTNSLEDKLKGRLQDYEAPPPPGMGGAIIDQVSEGPGSSPWLVSLALLLGVLLIGTGYYMISGQEPELQELSTADQTVQNAESPQTPASSAQTSRIDLAEKSTYSHAATDNSGSVPTWKPEGKEEVVKNILSASEMVVSSSNTSDIQNAYQPFTNAPLDILQETVSRISGSEAAIIADENDETDWGSHSLEQLNSRSLSDINVGPSELSTEQILLYTPSVVRPSKKQRHYHWYGDLGVFFLYNHLQPNRYDNLIMENFETSGSFSLDRLSYFAEFGLRRELSRRVTLRASAVANLFAQKYSFDIRDETSSAVTPVGNETELLTPVFDRQTIQMDHFLLSAGVRLSTDIKVFNNDLNRLMLGLGYHRILNPEQTFEYGDETHTVEYPHQLTASFGFRKVVWQSDKGELSLLPVLRYGLVHQINESSALTIKPFSVGLTMGYGLK